MVRVCGRAVVGPFVAQDPRVAWCPPAPAPSSGRRSSARRRQRRNSRDRTRRGRLRPASPGAGARRSRRRGGATRARASGLRLDGARWRQRLCRARELGPEVQRQDGVGDAAVALVADLGETREDGVVAVVELERVGVGRIRGRARGRGPRRGALVVDVDPDANGTPTRRRPWRRTRARGRAGRQSRSERRRGRGRRSSTAGSRSARSWRPRSRACGSSRPASPCAPRPAGWAAAPGPWHGRALRRRAPTGARVRAAVDMRAPSGGDCNVGRTAPACRAFAADS